MDSEPEQKTEITPETVKADLQRHRGVVSRIRRWQILFAAIGFPAWWLFGGQREALSFAVGAIASIASFGMLDRLTAAVGGGPVSGSGLALSAMRILLIGGALFVIMKTYSLHPLAAGTGLLTTVAAIMIEALAGSLLCMNLV
jgi:ATP synthase I chain